MRSLGVRKIAVAGVLSAVIIVLGITRLGFIPSPLGAIVIMHVPVILGAVLEGPAVGLITGFLFGLFSLIQAAVAATAPLDAAFVNPLISIAPRLFIGPGAWLIYALVSGSIRSGSAPEAGGGRIVRETAGIIAAAAGGT
ncbi:MAG: ECF transporter S component, partial [Treponema sp.]|nr:ECF transporter S component [Treponema sp.]